MEEKEKNKAAEEAMNKLVKEILKNGDVKTVFDVESKLKQSFGKVIQSMLEAEMTEHLGHNKYEYSKENKNNYRNGSSSKKVKSNLGELELNIPRDRNGEFEPKIVSKYSRDISNIEQQIINLYSMGTSTREISEYIEEMYGFSVSAEMVSNITDKIIPEMEEWKTRRLEEVYPFVYIDAIHFNVKENGVVGKKAAYVAMGISKNGIKEVLGIYVGENESSKFWMTVFNNLKNRGIKDILVLSSDGLTGIKEAIQVAFPNTEHQTCIVHLTRNTLKYVSHKDKYKFAQDLKAIYTASDEEIGRKLMYETAEKWKEKYPTAMDRWEDNWGIISPFYKFSQKIRKMIYTTNTIESLNSCYRRLNKSRNVYPSKEALLKVLYLSTKKVTKNWTSRVPEWGEVLRELEIVYDGRI
jgi:transposase-like protein